MSRSPLLGLTVASMGCILEANPPFDPQPLVDGSSGVEPSGAESSEAEDPSVCGDGVLDPGELCDDGNSDDTDACTSQCVPPSCTDGLKSGTEVGIDCGGDCPERCATGETCADDRQCSSAVCENQRCVAIASCKELHALRPELPDGIYAIETSTGPAMFHCDMTQLGGGWTRIVRDDFGGPGPWPAWNTSAVDECPSIGTFLGRFNGEVVERTIEVPELDHAELRLVANMVFLDSWDVDDDTLAIELGEEEVWAWSYGCWNEPCDVRGTDCFNAKWPEGVFAVAAKVPFSGTSIPLRIVDSLQTAGVEDEAWGVLSIEVYVR